MAHGTGKRPLDFCGNWDYVTSQLRLDEDTAILRIGGCVSSGVCLTVTILRRQRPWRRYALYCLPFKTIVVDANVLRATFCWKRIAWEAFSA